MLMFTCVWMSHSISHSHCTSCDIKVKIANRNDWLVNKHIKGYYLLMEEQFFLRLYPSENISALGIFISFHFMPNVPHWAFKLDTFLFFFALIASSMNGV